MINNIKNILNSLKNTKNSVADTHLSIVKFVLSYKDLEIGYLEFSPNDETWLFRYTEEFKNQNAIAPIISFPIEDKVYQGKQLWSFFSSRIPDNVGSSTSESKIKKENNTLVDLLKSYGKKTITNPFELSFA